MRPRCAICTHKRIHTHTKSWIRVRTHTDTQHALTHKDTRTRTSTHTDSTVRTYLYIMETHTRKTQTAQNYEPHSRQPAKKHTYTQLMGHTPLFTHAHTQAHKHTRTHHITSHINHLQVRQVSPRWRQSSCPASSCCRCTTTFSAWRVPISPKRGSARPLTRPWDRWPSSWGSWALR